MDTDGLAAPSEAIATYDKAIALSLQDLQVNPRDATTLEHLAEYLCEKGDSARALEFHTARPVHRPRDDSPALYAGGDFFFG